jgi:hypothetical protein
MIEGVAMAWIRENCHHRPAVVEFDNPGAKEFELVVKDVAGVKERVFKF